MVTFYKEFKRLTYKYAYIDLFVLIIVQIKAIKKYGSLKNYTFVAIKYSVTKREKERERERDRKRARERKKERKKERWTDCQTDGDRETGTARNRERQKQTDQQTEKCLTCFLNQFDKI